MLTASYYVRTYRRIAYRLRDGRIRNYSVIIPISYIQSAMDWLVCVIRIFAFASCRDNPGRGIINIDDVKMLHCNWNSNRTMNWLIRQPPIHKHKVLSYPLKQGVNLKQTRNLERRQDNQIATQKTKTAWITSQDKIKRKKRHTRTTQGSNRFGLIRHRVRTRRIPDQSKRTSNSKSAKCR